MTVGGGRGEKRGREGGNERRKKGKEIKTKQKRKRDLELTGSARLKVTGASPRTIPANVVPATRSLGFGNRESTLSEKTIEPLVFSWKFQIDTCSFHFERPAPFGSRNHRSPPRAPMG